MIPRAAQWKTVQHTFLELNSSQTRRDRMIPRAAFWKTVLIFSTLLPFLVLFSILATEKTEQIQTRMVPAPSSTRQLLSENLSSMSSAAGIKDVGQSEHPQQCPIQQCPIGQMLQLQHFGNLGISQHTRKSIFAVDLVCHKCKFSTTKKIKI